MVWKIGRETVENSKKPEANQLGIWVWARIWKYHYAPN